MNMSASPNRLPGPMLARTVDSAVIILTHPDLTRYKTSLVSPFSNMIWPSRYRTRRIFSETFFCSSSERSAKRTAFFTYLNFTLLSNLH